MNRTFSALSNEQSKLETVLTPAEAPGSAALRIGELGGAAVAVQGALDPCLGQ